MPNQQIFCNAPWFELQIYWDGSLGFCCQEDRVLYPESQRNHYNVANMTIAEWIDSEPMRQARMAMFGETKNKICTRCYNEEDFGESSRRHRCNQKSVIFTKTNFKESYEQSPHHGRFEFSKQKQGAWDRMPVDLHIDLGNYCNLTCKMCRPEASSRIAVQHVKWGIESARPFIGSNWTADAEVWINVLEQIADIPSLSNIHFMGGETLLTQRFEDFIDFMIDRKRFDLNFSFVTNGTTFNESIINKLKRFGRVGIEVSIETISEHNAYQRQGTDTDIVLYNLQRYSKHCNGSNITLTLRPAISALTIGRYWTLLRYCLENKFLIKALLVTRPNFLDIRVLPEHIRAEYVEDYVKLLQEFNLESVDATVDHNESDPNQLDRIIKNQITQCLNLLSAPCMPDSENLLTEMVGHCRRWDDVHGYNALELYPELKDEFIKRGY